MLFQSQYGVAQSRTGEKGRDPRSGNHHPSIEIVFTNWSELFFSHLCHFIITELRSPAICSFISSSSGLSLEQCHLGQEHLKKERICCFPPPAGFLELLTVNIFSCPNVHSFYIYFTTSNSL